MILTPRNIGAGSLIAWLLGQGVKGRDSHLVRLWTVDLEGGRDLLLDWPADVGSSYVHLERFAKSFFSSPLGYREEKMVALDALRRNSIAASILMGPWRRFSFDRMILGRRGDWCFAGARDEAVTWFYGDSPPRPEVLGLWRKTNTQSRCDSRPARPRLREAPSVDSAVGLRPFSCIWPTASP